MTASEWIETQLDRVRAADQWRQVRPFDAFGAVGTRDGRRLVSFASNDYLGLSTHPSVTAAATAAISRWGTGATASRLVVGSRPVHHELEEELAAWKGTDAALLFPTGYAANLGLLTTLGGPDCLIVSDELNHASIIDGCRLSRSEVAVARHNDAGHVAELLAGRQRRRAVVVTDSVFSMDGDEAPLEQLAQVCATHDAVLVCDDAHAVLGPTEPEWPEDLVVARVVTMSKGLGALGGAVCGPRSLIDLLINRARPFIFTTGSSPADAAAALEAVRITRSEEGAALLHRLRAVTDRIRSGHPSPIVPVVLGPEAAALRASDELLALGLLVPAIRPPTVAPGTSRLRIAMSASHTDDQVDQLVDALDRLAVVPS